MTYYSNGGLSKEDHPSRVRGLKQEGLGKPERFSSSPRTITRESQLFLLPNGGYDRTSAMAYLM